VKICASTFISFSLLTCCFAQQEQKPTPQLPPGSGGIRTPPPPLPKYPDVRQPGETGFYVGVFAWFPQQNPTFNKGHAATFTDSSQATLEGTPKYAESAEIGIALGLHNALHLSYFEDRASGNFTNGQELVIWNQTYPKGNYVSTNYRLQSAKATFDYLTWPYPVQTSRFRLRTMWGVQYTAIKTGFDLPLLPTTDSSGNPLTDASGNPLTYAASGSHWFILPSLGVQVTEYLTRKLRLEASASGFDIPHHSNQWDAEASANFRTGHLELRVGAKAFHFRTTTQSEFYMSGTQAAPFLGIRWYSQ
jgi:hypothetical protein